jgi:hypothetical protein
MVLLVFYLVLHEHFYPLKFIISDFKWVEILDLTPGTIDLVTLSTMAIVS